MKETSLKGKRSFHFGQLQHVFAVARSGQGIREGEAPAEPFGVWSLLLRGSAGASPSRDNDPYNLLAIPVSKEKQSGVEDDLGAPEITAVSFLRLDHPDVA